jgi:hypothetical protein
LVEARRRREKRALAGKLTEAPAGEDRLVGSDFKKFDDGKN